ncbi:MAG: TraR/DksA family transcriptional regulator [Acidimicrobiales bacterium]
MTLPRPAKARGRSAATKPVSKAQLAKLRALLEKERGLARDRAQALTAELGQLTTEAHRSELQFDEESGEGAALSVEVDRDRTLRSQSLVELGEIEAAMARLAIGTYGVCETCAQPIPVERLEALPAARLCIGCKNGARMAPDNPGTDSTGPHHPGGAGTSPHLTR